MFRKLILLATATILLFSFSTTFASDEVKVAFASLNRDTSPGAGRCPSCFNVFGEIEVKNLARNKEVWVWYNTGSGGWKSQKAVYDAQIGNGKETWDFFIGLGNIFPATIQFAVQYKVNGQTYWDNNSTKNYTLGGSSPFSKLNTVNLFPTDVKAKNDSFEGGVIVKNIATDKKVKIVYTLNNWVSKEETAATFRLAFGAYDFWSFSKIIPPFDCRHLPNIQYFVNYTVAGITYTDNNHGRNYTVKSFETFCPAL